MIQTRWTEGWPRVAGYAGIARAVLEHEIAASGTPCTRVPQAGWGRSHLDINIS
jgi:hypothetical protein